jgi:hypothetical protein
VTLIKSIVVCLALANVGYFLWASGIGKSNEVPAAPGAATLKLASETRGGAAAGAAAAGIPMAGTPAVGTSAPAPSTAAAPVSPREEGSGGNAGLLTNVQRCISVGPFRDMSEAARAASTLRGGGYDPRQRVAEGEVWAGTWVYLPLPASKAAADQIFEKLKAGGIDDALEMPGPNDGSVISLGLFSEAKRAQARVAQAQALHINPAIADRKRSGNVYWIDIDLKPTDSLLNPADLQGEAGRIVRLEVKACPAGAPR